MSSTKSLTRRALSSATAKLSIGAAAGTMAVAMGFAAASGASAATSGPEPFSFALQASPGIASCLPHASGRVTVTPGKLNDTMRVSVRGLPARTGFDLFVIQTPNKPFGVSWYQTDVNTGRHGNGTATVRGIFDQETFSVSPGGTTTFAPTHQYHLGLWFNNPNTPFRLGCEPGATQAVVTPFNGEQHAGIQVLNTAEFPDNAGPLSHVHR
jgi:hypothetical protein